MMVLELIRYWKIKLKLRFSPQIQIPPEWSKYVRQTAERAVERQTTVEAWKSIWKEQREKEKAPSIQP